MSWQHHARRLLRGSPMRGGRRAAAPRPRAVTRWAASRAAAAMRRHRATRCVAPHAAPMLAWRHRTRLQLCGADILRCCASWPSCMRRAVARTCGARCVAAPMPSKASYSGRNHHHAAAPAPAISSPSLSLSLCVSSPRSPWPPLTAPCMHACTTAARLVVRFSQSCRLSPPAPAMRACPWLCPTPARVSTHAPHHLRPLSTPPPLFSVHASRHASRSLVSMYAGSGCERARGRERRGSGSRGLRARACVRACAWERQR